MDLYQVLEQVGEGAYGRVFKGRRKHVGQVVALKFIPKVGRSEKELQSLKREIEIMRGLKHPHIVQLFDSFETSAEVVVVTEYAEGQLFQILEDDGNLPESQVREMACQLLSALHYLHSHRILHRDMKPQNIVLGKSGVVKLCDFGFSRAMSASTMVLTSFKGSPLYMSPEMVEGKPYDQTADLWSLGVILYELHTGVPPFNANSIYSVMQLITKGQVKWPDTMSDTCTSFLKGLLTKDPQKRLTWPDILHHPFVADRVSVLADTGSYSPLTARLSPDMQALKLKQIAAKMQPNSGESVLMQKAREYDARTNRGKQVGSEKVKKNGWENERAVMAEESPRQKSPSAEVFDCGHPVTAATNRNLSSKTQAPSRPKHRGQISIDYEREFPSVEVGPRLGRRCSQNVESEDYWEKLAQESDPSSQRKELINHTTIVPQLKSKLLAFKARLTSGSVEGVCIVQPLRLLRNLILTSDPEKSYEIGQKLGLPRVLFDLLHDAVENLSFITQPQSVPALGEMLVTLRIYWEKHHDWAKVEQRLEEFSRPFYVILQQPNLLPVAPLAASVLSLFIQHNVDVKVDMDSLTFLLKNLLLDSYEPHISPLPGWGLCDGLLSLLFHTFLEDKRSSGPLFLDPSMFADLWKRVGASLAKATPDTDFCSANGLYSFLSAALFLFTKDPYSCIPLFSECESRCVYALGRLLGTDCRQLFAAVTPERQEVDVSHDGVSALCCQLLIIPFALDLPSHTMSTIIQLYDSCAIVTSLLQVIQSFPPLQLELPLSLLSRLFLCDPGRSVFHLKKSASGFFTPPSCSQPAAVEHQPWQSRSASSLLSELLQLDELWDSAVELLILLSQIACCSSKYSRLELHLEASVLHQALKHSHCQIKATACRLLGNLNPFRPSTLHTLHPAMFKSMIDCLHDCCVPVRRMACRAVGNWLGYIAVGFKNGWCNERSSDSAGWCKEKQQNKHRCSHGGAAGDMAAVVGDCMHSEAGRDWMKEARRTANVLASLITDPDSLTRRHCCEALGNLRHVDGALSLLLEENVFGLLLRAACTDTHNAVRQAAVATLSLYCRQDSVRQVLKSHNASEKLLKALRHTPPHCDVHQLIEQL